jgi:hypothetical protein
MNMFRVDRCGTTTVAGTASARLTGLGRGSVAVQGSIYRVNGGSSDDIVFGLVLRAGPANFYFLDTVRFRSDAGLTHSIENIPASFSLLGIPLPVQLAGLTMVFNNASSTGTFAVTNPTRCTRATFTATATYSDGESRNQSTGFTPTGCPTVPFEPELSFQTANSSAGMRTSFAVLFHQPYSNRDAVMRSHAESISADLSKIGSFDFTDWDAIPGCTPAELDSSAGCPASSRVGKITGNIMINNGKSGYIFKTNSPGHKTVGEITLRSGVRHRWDGEFSDGIMQITGLPELPFTTLGIEIETEILVSRATCDNGYSASLSSDGYSGARYVRLVPRSYANCQLRPPTIDSGPADGITINTSHVEYRFSSTEPNSTFLCKLGNEPAFPCTPPITWSGLTDGTHTFAVAVTRGGKTSPSASRTFTVDTTPPVVTLTEPIDADSDGDGFADERFRPAFFDVFFEAVDTGSGIASLTCRYVAHDGSPAGLAKLTKADAGRTSCQVQDAPDGDGTVEIRAVDHGGHVTVLKRSFTVDTSPPVVTLTAPGDIDADGDGFADQRYRPGSFEIPFELSDPESGAERADVGCEIVTPTYKGKGIVKGIGSSPTPVKASCQIDGAPEGDGVVEITAKHKYIGTVTIVKIAITIDSQGPTVTHIDARDNDSDGDGYADDRLRPDSFSVLFSAIDDLSGVDKSYVKCLVRGWDPKKKEPIIGSSEKAGDFSCDVSDAPAGDITLEFSARDHGGHVTVLKRSFEVDGSPPVIELTDFRDADSDGDGIADSPDRPADFDVPFEVTHDYGRFDPLSAECSATDQGGKAVESAKIIMDRDSGRSKGYCRITGANPGDLTLSISGRWQRAGIGHTLNVKRAYKITS